MVSATGPFEVRLTSLNLVPALFKLGDLEQVARTSAPSRFPSSEMGVVEEVLTRYVRQLRSHVDACLTAATVRATKELQIVEAQAAETEVAWFKADSTTCWLCDLRQVA